ncbi:MAG TPA: GNAT family N-acetyltransferase [Cellvibrio sp.]|nr:GNAT family N-acetyltransferase [Cellvibrio sp.]
MQSIQHLPEQNKFVVNCEPQEAVLHYRLSQGDNQVTKIDFISTFVPTEFRGKGLAEQLVRTGIQWAREQGYELHASCWYAAQFIR